MTKILNTTDRDIAHAAEMLADGRLVAFGTETVYGLGADAQNAKAVAAVYEAKGRPHFNPLICHYAAAEAAFEHVEASSVARKLADTFWPGPLTLVLPRRTTCPVALLAGAGLETLAVRVPAHAVAQRLIAALGRPVAAPSANRSGRTSPTTARHVLAQLEGRIGAVIDSGPCRVGLESTVLDLSGSTPLLLRPGGVSREALEAAIGGRLPVAGDQPLTHRSPGLLLSHYAPALPLRINAAAMNAHEALLAFGPPLENAAMMFQLSDGKNLNEAAANLFEGLHWLDAHAPLQGLDRIAAMPVPMQGLGLAINDRLARAAHSGN